MAFQGRRYCNDCHPAILSLGDEATEFSLTDGEAEATLATPGKMAQTGVPGTSTEPS